MLNKNITEIVNKELCIGCGACQGVCPVEAITFQWKKNVLLPVVLKNCNFCGICNNVCPGQGIDYGKLNTDIFGQVPDNILIGNYLKILAGHSTDDSIRYKSSSGGLVTSLLILALEERIIDAAVVLGFDKNNPLIPKPFIARTPEEIISSMGSKYTSGPVDSMISEIVRNKGKYAFVGLPCHLEALIKAELLMKELKERIVLRFGLFCQTRVSYDGVDFWLKMNKINPQDITEFSYRGNGWPGEMNIKLKNGQAISYPLTVYWQFMEKFVPMRCTLCTDALAEFADISFGDAWVSEFAEDKKGTSIIVVRSEIGNKLIDIAVNKKKICLSETDCNMLLHSQRVTLKFKKEEYYYRAKLLSLMGKKMPTYEGGFIKNGSGSYIESLTYYLKRWVFQQKFLWNFIFHWIAMIKPLLKKLYLLIRALLTKILRPLFWFLMIGEQLMIECLVTRRKKYPGIVKNVLIINQADMLNKGDAAILTATMKIVDRAFPGALVVVVSHTPQVDKPRCNVKVVSSYRFLRAGNFWSVIKTARVIAFVIIYRLTKSYKIFSLPILKIIANETFIEYAKADLVVHRGGDNLTEDYGIPYIYFDSLLISIMLRKPTVVMGESIGVFAAKYSKRLAKIILDNVDIIVAREKISVENLQKMNISSPKIVTLPDTAFVLEPSNKEKLQSFIQSENLGNLKKPVIAISISTLISKYAFHSVPENQRVEHLVSTMIDVVKYCQEKFGASIVFIPHVIGKGNDDRVISRQIVDTLENRNGVYVIQGEYSHEDYKSFLGEYAEIFIGARMHAAIAAVSSGVPTLAFAYSQKTHGIIGEMLGLTDFIVDVRQAQNGSEFLRETISKIELLWNHRNMVREMLTQRMIGIKEEAWKNAEILRGILWKKP